MKGAIQQWLENIVVGIVLGGFLIFSIWGLRVGAEQARRDAQAAAAGRELAKRAAKAEEKSKVTTKNRCRHRLAAVSIVRSSQAHFNRVTRPRSISLLPAVRHVFGRVALSFYEADAKALALPDDKDPAIVPDDVAGFRFPPQAA